MNNSECVICYESLVAIDGSADIELLPCRHIFHRQCLQPIRDNGDGRCPYCRQMAGVPHIPVPIAIEEPVIEEPAIEEHAIQEAAQLRGNYRSHSLSDRTIVVEAAARGDDWRTAARLLNINVKSAYNWIRKGTAQQKSKGGKKPKLLQEEQIDSIIQWVSEDCQLTLAKISEKVNQEFGVHLALSTIGNYLDGRLFTHKKIHTEPQGMNTGVNKASRRQYVLQLTEFLGQGKEIIWIDETNFNLFCNRTKGWARAGDRAVVLLPNSKGPNLHVIGGMTAAGMVYTKLKRGSFRKEDAQAWLRNMLFAYLQGGHILNNVVVVCDNAPCHSHIEEVLEEEAFVGAQLLRLSPYSCMLNPIENIWSKLKSKVKASLGIPAVIAGELTLAEQRMRRLEEVVTIALRTIVPQDCLRSANHSTSMHPRALAMEDMQVGM